MAATTLNIIGIETAHGLKTLELALGDLCDIKCDLLGVSAFKGDYSPKQGTLVGALLTRHQFSLAEASKVPALDLREQFGIWITERLEGFPFERILCVEMAGRTADPTKAMENFFVGVAVLEAMGQGVATMALPLLGAGNQAFDPEQVATPLLEQASGMLRRSSCVNRIIFSELSEERAATLNRELDRQLGGALHAQLPRKEMAMALLADLRAMVGRLQPLVQGASRRMAGELLAVVSREAPSAMEVGLQGRRLAEVLTAWLQPERTALDLAGRIDGLRAFGIAPWLVSYLHTLRIIGNEVVHIREQVSRAPQHLAEEDVTLCLFCMARVTQFWLDQVAAMGS
jgi:hypothetical protein